MIQVFNAVNLGQIFAVAVIASAIWWQSDSVSDIAGSLFFISIQQSFNGLNVSAGKVVEPHVAHALGYEVADIDAAISALAA